VGWQGQQWTSLEEMRRQGFSNKVERIRARVHQIVTTPQFGIGQRALLVQTRSGNLLWDCVTYLDDATISNIKNLGGVDCIAISHPHLFASFLEWSEAFGGIPVYLHELDRKWAQRKSPRIVYWGGRKTSPLPGVRLVNLGGHFDGSSVLHWEDSGKGVLLTGDTIYVVTDRRWVSFMHSYPNLIPLPTRKVRAIASRIRPYKFEELYSGFEGREIVKGADLAVQLSAQRYIERLK
jgi:glyoxylase-like metal-dependent hydrolase (beta-lactamase superfamily II)